MKGRTVLITGATGLLGSQVLLQLIAQQYTVYAVKRAHSIIPVEANNINWIEVNSTQGNLFHEIPEPIDFVIHAGALVSYKKSDQAKLFEVNTEWTTQLGTDAKEAGVKKFIFVSSISALGKNAKDNRIDETTPKSEGEFTTNYGKSKRQAEVNLWQLSEEGLPILIFNPSVIIGPAKRYQSSAQLFAYVHDQKPFYTQGLLNYVDVRDVAKAIVVGLENKIVNEQFILNAGSVSYRDFFKTIATQLKVKAPAIGVPKFMVMLGAILENIISKISRKPATLTMETAKMAGSNKIYNAEKVKIAFNMPYITLEQSIQWTVTEMQIKGEL